MIKDSVRRSVYNIVRSGVSDLTLRGDPYADYAFYYLPDAGRDKVSGQPIAEGFVEEGFLNTHGAYTQLIKMSEDISDGVWAYSAAAVTVNEFQATGTNGNLRQIVTTLDAVQYTFSFLASVEVGGQTTGYVFRHADSATTATTYLTLSTEPTLKSVTVLGRSGGGNISFGFIDTNTSNWAKVTITNFQVTQSPYLLPYVPNDTIGTVSVPHTYSDADEGPKFTLAGMPQVIGSLDGVADGAELLVNGGFDGDLSGWIVGPGWSYLDGTAACLAALSDHQLAQSVLTVGKTYELTFTVVTYTSGNLGMFDGGGWAVPLEPRTPDTTYITRFVAAGTSVAMYPGAFIGSIDNISVKEISPAKGEMVVEWIPMFDYDVTGESGSIITPVNDVNILLRHTVNGWIILEDGPTTVYAVPQFQAGVLYTIKATWGTHPIDGPGKMQIVITDGTTTWESTVVDFVGSFNPEDFLSIGWENTYWQKIKSVKIYKEPKSW